MASNEKNTEINIKFSIPVFIKEEYPRSDVTVTYPKKTEMAVTQSPPHAALLC